MEAFAVLFITIGPVDNSVIFASLTRDSDASFRRRMAIKSILVATIIMLAFGLVGDDLLDVFGISLSSLEISGGILLLIVAIRMVMEEPVDDISEEGTVSPDQDIAIFPLAMPLIAGPDALVAVVIQVKRAQEDFLMELSVLGLTVLVLVITLISFLMAGKLMKVFGQQGMEVISRVLGVLLTALAVEFIVDGLSKSVLFA
jgi:multiple antibiotic resistance protein